MKRKWIPVLMLGVIMTCLAGCGSSLFKSFAGSSSQTNLDSTSSLLDSASSKADFTAAKEKAKTLINDSTVSTANRLSAEFMYGEAIATIYWQMPAGIILANNAYEP